VVYVMFVELQYTASERSSGHWMAAAFKCIIALLIAGIGYSVQYFFMDNMAHDANERLNVDSHFNSSRGSDPLNERLLNVK
jgi:hypothetical protein